MENHSKVASFKSLMTGRVWPAIRPTVNVLLAIAIIVGAVVIGALLPLVGAVFGDYSSVSPGVVLFGIIIGLILFALGAAENSEGCGMFGMWLFASSMLSLALAGFGDFAKPGDLGYLPNEQRLVTIESDEAVFPLWKDVIIARNVRNVLRDEVTIVEAPGQLATLGVALNYNVTTAAGDLAGGEARDYKPDLETAFKLAVAETKFVGSGDEVALAAYGTALKSQMCDNVVVINKLFSCPLELQVNLTYRNATRTININEA